MATAENTELWAEVTHMWSGPLPVLPNTHTHTNHSRNSKFLWEGNQPITPGRQGAQTPFVPFSTTRNRKKEHAAERFKFGFYCNEFWKLWIWEFHSCMVYLTSKDGRRESSIKAGAGCRNCFAVKENRIKSLSNKGLFMCEIATG